MIENQNENKLLESIKNIRNKKNMYLNVDKKILDDCWKIIIT